MSITGDRVCQEITRRSQLSMLLPVQVTCRLVSGSQPSRRLSLVSQSIKTLGSIQATCTSHFQYWISGGSPRPRASRIFCLTSGGTVRGTFAIGSPGASCNSMKTAKLMNSSVGSDRISRRVA